MTVQIGGYVDNNLISSSSWTVGYGSIGIFNQNGATEENQRYLGTDPWGNSAIVWKTRPMGGNNDDGGWNTSWFDIDRTKLYRFSVWMKRTSSTTGGTFYFGMYANGSQAVQLSDNAANGNPYWDCRNISSYTQNQWYLAVAHVYPFDAAYGSTHPETGFYTVSGGRISNITYCNIGAGDLRWNSDSTSGMHRTYHYYCPDNTSSIEFFAPRVDLCDGSEPSIQNLLSNSPRYGVVFPNNKVLGSSTQTESGSLISVKSYRSSATWVKPSGCSKVVVRVIGGGGGAAGYTESGGAGGYAERTINVESITSVAVTVGAGGANVGYYAAGGDGGTSSFGPYISATGGYGSNRNVSHTGGYGGVGSGGDINLYGGGGTGHSNSINSGAIGRGGSSFLGGASGTNRPNGGSRVGHGAPGSGGPGGRTDANHAGGPGEPGAVIIWEYR